ncbi:BglG family transcription antiterminator [Streptococcus cuniculi]|nr:PRD domain-containing protein [Streptococcus cuniculi]MBF0779236.1 PRD domain-containing protein [Streptococcus cuniculi]
MKKEKLKELLSFLLKATDYVTSEQLAEHFKISKVTIIRWISYINNHYEQPMIISERGIGYKLNYSTYLRTISFMDFDSEEERCREVIRELLLIAPKSKRIDLIYDKFFISESVMKKDQQIISKKLERYGLQLERHNRSLAIVGNEKCVRDAIMEMVLNVHQATDITAIEKYSKDINHSDFKFAIRQLEFASDVLGEPIQYPYNISFFSHIYVLLNRVKHYQSVTVGDDFKELKQEERLAQPEIYSVCKQIIRNIVQYLGREIEQNEVYYLFDYLSSARLDKETDHVLIRDLTKRITEDYISIVSKKLNIVFEASILHELSFHIQYMLERLEKDILLTNALLEEIALGYKGIYEAVLEASVTISNYYLLPTISRDESGFIALYFAKYLELGIKKINAYVICTTGLGTSELLAVKIRQTLPAIQIVGMSASINISKTIHSSPHTIDLLISTVPIKEQVDIPVVLVSAILTSRDIVALNTTVGELVNEN